MDRGVQGCRREQEAAGCLVRADRCDHAGGVKVIGVAVRSTGVAALVLIIFALGSAGTAAANCTKTWIGGFSSSWFDWQNWTQCDAAPNNQEAPDSDDSVVINGATVSIDGGTHISSLTLGSTSPATLNYTSAHPNPFMLADNGIAVNSGSSITLDGTNGNSNAPARLAVGSSPGLVNNGTITITGSTNFGPPALAGNVVNNGTIDVNASASFNESGTGPSILDNRGTINIANGAVLVAPGQSCADTGDQVTNDTGGRINATGTGTLNVLNFTQGAGTTGGTSPYPVVETCGFLHYTGSGASRILANAGFRLSGALHSGQSLTIRGDNANTNADASAGGFTNGGKITLDCLAAGCAYREAPAINVGTKTLVNSGTITVTAAGTGASFNGNVTNRGIVQLNGDATVGGGGTYRQTAGATTIAHGHTFNPNGTVTLSGGTLDGTGTLNGTVSNTGGTVAPGPSLGTLTVTGNYTQGAGGALQIFVKGKGAGQFSVLSVGGNPTLAGTLRFAPSSGYAASAGRGDNLRGFLMYGGTRSGKFAHVTSKPPLSGGKTFTAIYVDASKRVDATVR